MKKIEQLLKDQKIINKSELAKRIGLSKQVLNNKIKGNNNNSLTESEKTAIRLELTEVLTEVIKS